MQPHPEFKAFERLYTQGKPVLLWHKASADLLTPVAALLKLMPLSPCRLLFESAEGERKTRGRYSIIAIDPDVIWRCVGGKAEICRMTASHEVFTEEREPPFDSLRQLLARSKVEVPEELPPMATGLFGYLGYDMVRLMERLPDINPDSIGIPDAMLIRPRIVVIFDGFGDELFIATPVWVEEGQPAKQVYQAASDRIERAYKMLTGPVPEQKGNMMDQLLTFIPHVERSTYHKIVEKTKEYITAGDIFQAVLSRRWEASFPVPAIALYRALRHLNPSPYLFFAEFNGMALVGSSPEILVRVRNNVVTIRPIAGTRRRGKDEVEDRALAAELLADQKELAEHLMLLDLGRNDVGRVAKSGTVKVTERMIIEYYSHVMHIVSNVEGVLREDKDIIDALIAGFPAGTVSGAPKIRAMEIIDELENEKRSFYGGCVGYFSPSGSMDTCITLRTALVKDGTLYVQAGGGVVADSGPEAEFQETESKARALFAAAQEASDYL